MTRPSSTRAQDAAGGTGRRDRRRREAPPEQAWVRPYKQAHRALDSAASLIFSTRYDVADAEDCAEQRPYHSVQMLTGGIRQMVVATKRHIDAKRYLAEATEALERMPEELQDDAAELLELANERCEAVEKYIAIAASEAIAGAAAVMGGIATGELVPEKNPSDGGPRRRVILAPRPIFVRAFLAARRQPRVAERITPVLRRRRRMPRPAEVRVPRRNLRGRAPPVSSTCLL